MKIINAIDLSRQSWQSLRHDGERWPLVRSALAMMLTRISGVCCAFLTSMAMARVLGAAGYGMYAYVMAIATVLSVPAALGLPQYLVREASGCTEQLLKLRHWADRWVVAAGITAALVMLLIAKLTDAPLRGNLFAIAALIPLLTGLSGVRRGLLQANGLIARSQFAPLVLAPLITLAGVMSLWLFSIKVEAWEIMLLTLAASTTPCIVNSLQLRKMRKKYRTADSAQPTGVTIGASLRFMWLGALYLLLSRTDLIMIGALSGDRDTGIYAVASRAADLVSLLLTAANMVIAPHIARLYRDGKLQQLQALLTSSMRMVTWASLPIVLILFIGAQWLLPLFYGTSYATGTLVLRLLVFSQFILVLGGPLGTTLEMTGNEKASLITMIWVVLLNIALNAFLIPTLGANGAASATCLSVIVGRVMLWRQVRKLLSFRPTALGV